MRYIHRHGALLGGVEGQFKEVPGFVDPRGVDTFIFEQNATTDNTGMVIYQSEIFDLMVGWHFYNSGKIWRYMQATIFPKGVLTSTMPSKGSDWHAFFDDSKGGAANKMIWSGSGGNKQGRIADGVAPSSGLMYGGQFRRGIVRKDANGDVELNSSGEPRIEEVKMFGIMKQVNFSAIAYAGGEVNKVYVSDTDALSDDSSSKIKTSVGPDFPLEMQRFAAEKTANPTVETLLDGGKDFEIA